MLLLVACVAEGIEARQDPLGSLHWIWLILFEYWPRMLGFLVGEISRLALARMEREALLCLISNKSMHECDHEKEVIRLDDIAYLLRSFSV